METVIQLRSDVAKAMQGTVDVGEAAGELWKATRDLEQELDRLGVSLEPVHPGTQDAELARYFTLSETPEFDPERILAPLRGLEAVTAAYVKPQAQPA